LSSTARAVSERCGGLVRRRTRPCKYHPRESYEPREPNESCDPDRSCEPNKSFDLNESCDHNECHDYNESPEPSASRQCPVTTSGMRRSTSATHLALGMNAVVAEQWWCCED
jgi:hypothetical protein